MKTPSCLIGTLLTLAAVCGCQGNSSNGTSSDLNESILSPVSVEQVARIDLTPEDEAMGEEGTFYPPANVVASPDGMHVAYPDRDANGWYVALDEKKGKYYKGVGGPIVFSPDSTQMAYRAYQDEGACVVVNEKPGKVYASCGSIVFSRDSKHMAYSARRGDQSFWVIDGVEQKGYDELGRLVFNRDGSRHAYPASLEGRAFIVENGVEGKSYDFICDGPVYSPDGKRMAYSAGYGKAPPSDKSNDNYDPSWNITFQKTRAVAVIDGMEQPTTYGHIYGFVFSPDSRRMAYIAAPGAERYLVLDGVKGQEFLVIVGDSVTFSSDSQRVMYSGAVNGEWYMMVDANMYRASSLIGPPIFSPDGKRTAWLQEKLMGKAFLIVDGKGVEIPRRRVHPLASVNESGLTFTPDGQKLIYMAMIYTSAEKPGYAMVMNDRVIHYSYGLLGDIHFQPDGTVLFLEFSDRYHSVISRVTLKLQ